MTTRTKTAAGGTDRSRLLGFLALALAPFGSGASCLPADTRPPAGSILLTVSSDDQPSVTTEDGWSITVDRFLIGLGNALLGPGCGDYSPDGRGRGGYGRLLDAQRPEQKLSIMYGLGRCYFSFRMLWPSPDTVLGVGVSEADRQLMAGREGEKLPGDHLNGVAVDFGATATRGAETKRVHWLFRQPMTYGECVRTGSDAPSPAFELGSSDNLTLHIALRGVTLFRDDNGALRFDPIVAADDLHGNGDGEVTLNELANLKMEEARRWGRYAEGGGPTPSSLQDYLYILRLAEVVRFREDVACSSSPGFGDPVRPPP